jgi:hypothetical protein
MYYHNKDIVRFLLDTVHGSYTSADGCMCEALEDQIHKWVDWLSGYTHHGTINKLSTVRYKDGCIS